MTTGYQPRFMDTMGHPWVLVQHVTAGDTARETALYTALFQDCVCPSIEAPCDPARWNVEIRRPTDQQRGGSP